MESVLLSPYLHRCTDYIKWYQNEIFLKQMMGTLIERQGDIILIQSLCQRAPLVEHNINVKDKNDPEEDARDFELEEYEWNITVDRLIVVKLTRRQRNLKPRATYDIK
jgi:hypothetical protein